MINRVRQAYKEGRPSFGAYVMTPAPKMVEMMGFAGLDFVRIDLAETPMDIETVHHMIRAAHAVGITPFVRIPPGEERLIELALHMGALGIQISRVSSRADVEAAVRATKAPPIGERHASTSLFTAGMGQMSNKDHLTWVNENIMLSVQVETRKGIEAIDEIVSVPGLDMVQSGRGDLSYHYGVPGQQYHPLVLEAERKMIAAGMKAGKLVSVQYYPLNDPKHVETIRGFIRRGVHCLSLGTDREVVSVYRRLLAEINAR